MLRRKVLMLMVLVSMCFNANSQVNYAGKDFWLTLAYTTGEEVAVFYISGARDANITFNYTTPATTKTYFLKGGTILQIKLSSAEAEALAGRYQPIETVNNNSLHITSDENIVVQFLVMAGADDDGILLYPSDNQTFGNDYYLNGPAIINKEEGTYSSIVAGCDSTILEITPVINTRNHAAGIPYTITMNKGNAYILGFDRRYLNINTGGTRIRVLKSSCCNPINTFITYDVQFMMWPYSSLTCCADQFIEQILPISVWDTVFPMVRFVNNPYNVINIVSASDNNVIYFNGAPVYILNKGMQYDTVFKDPLVIKSSAPISVVQSMISQGAVRRPGLPVPVDSMSDPATLWVLPIKDGLREAYFKSATNIATGMPTDPFWGYTMNAVNLICKSSSVDSIMLNNVNIASRFTRFPRDTNYMYAVIKMDTTIAYHLVSRDKILAYYYGAYVHGSAAYPIGDIHVDEFVNFQKSYDTVVMCENSGISLTVGNAEKYLWSTGDTGNSIRVTMPGAYYVHMYYKEDCKRSGETITFQVNPKLYDRDTLTDTLYKCLRDTVTLVANAGANKYLWFNGDTVNQINITVPDSVYHVIETYTPQCLQIKHDFIVLPQKIVLPTIDLGPDTFLCNDQVIVLVGGGDDTRWSDGSIGNQLTVKPGTYWAWTEEQCLENSVADTIVIKDSACVWEYCNLTYPTAFTPNNDGNNDIFRAIYFGDFPVYNLNVFNRWGEKVYESFNIKDGWDGSYKGIPADIGVYYYIASYTCPLNGYVFTKGEMTLIR